LSQFRNTLEKKIKFFSSIDEFMYWYKHVRPHGAFDLSKLETPIQIFYRKLEDRQALIDPLLLTGV